MLNSQNLNVLTFKNLIMMFFFVIFVIPAVIFALIVAKSKIDYPEKSLFYCFLNACMFPARFLRFGAFREEVTLENAMKHAMNETKLSDFGDTTFVDSYSLLVKTPTHQSLKLTNLGCFMYHKELNMSMNRRLKFIQFLKDCPLVSKIRVPTPVFVMGLPRTGTTFLHRLLSLDPLVRAPFLWELLAPVPNLVGPGTAATFQADRIERNQHVRELIKQRLSMGDHAMDHIHEIGADLPEECLMALSDEIPVHLSFLYTIYLSHETFTSKIDHKRVVAAYEYYKKVLQLLSYQTGDTNSPKRWTLKCPLHLFYPREIAAAFSDAKLIWFVPYNNVLTILLSFVFNITLFVFVFKDA
jgi:hypothetical protein